jgi:hypothetical protein
VDVRQFNAFGDIDDGTAAPGAPRVFHANGVLLRVPDRFHSFFLAESFLNRY